MTTVTTRGTSTDVVLVRMAVCAERARRGCESLRVPGSGLNGQPGGYGGNGLPAAPDASTDSTRKQHSQAALPSSTANANRSRLPAQAKALSACLIPSDTDTPAGSFFNALLASLSL